MPPSEIDDIFAAKGKVKSLPSSKSSLKPDSVTKKSPKKKRKREAAQEDAIDAKEHDRPVKRKVPETIVDPSASLPASGKTKKSAQVEEREPVAKRPKKKEDKEAEERFKDSRGTGPSTVNILPSLNISFTMVLQGEKRRKVFRYTKRTSLG